MVQAFAPKHLTLVGNQTFTSAFSILYLYQPSNDTVFWRTRFDWWTHNLQYLTGMKANLTELPSPCELHVCYKWHTQGMASHWFQRGPQQHTHRWHGRRRYTAPTSTVHTLRMSYHCSARDCSSDISERFKCFYLLLGLQSSEQEMFVK